MTSARHSKVSPRWGTDPAYVAMSRVALGGRIELDPMSEPAFNAVVQAERIYTEQDDGLAHPWIADSLLLNPAGGLVVEAWRKLVTEYNEGRTKRAIWIGFSVEQLNLLADEPVHPFDFSLLLCRQRIDFLTLHPLRNVLRIAEFSTEGGMPTGWTIRLECGHARIVEKTKRPKELTMRCTACIGTPEPNGAPSHSNYVVGLGIAPQLFEMAFTGRGRFHHGALRVRQARAA